MDKKVNGMEKDSSLDGQENLKTGNAAGDSVLDGMGEPGNDDWEINIDELLEQADMLVNNEMLPPMPEFEGEANKRSAESGAAKSEASPKAASAPGPEAAGASAKNPEIDSDLDEINNLLEQADLNEKIDEDMLALLESATENQSDDNPDEVFDIFEEADTPLEDLPLSDSRDHNEPEQAQEEEGAEKKAKNAKKKKKKEKKSKKASGKNTEQDGDLEEGEKKPSFLSKIMALFGGHEDFGDDEPDTAADENVKILNELNGDEGKKSPKAAKKSAKKKENKKEKKNAKEAKPKAKAKKPAAPKKKKEKPVEKPAEKPVKVLNGKSFTAIAGLCLSIIAGVMIVTTFIPEYMDKQTVRKALQDQDYETIYLLLYDKKLNADETLLFNQSRIIRQMERRLESYENNIALGRELEAVDALMQGVEDYQELWEADEYQVRNAVEASYLQICQILESNYGINQEEAVAIASYDKVEYTKALYTLLGKDVSLGEEASQDEQSSEAESVGPEPGVEAAGEQQQDNESSEAAGLGDGSLEDVLPEEEDIIN